MFKDASEAEAFLKSIRFQYDNPRHKTSDPRWGARKGVPAEAEQRAKIKAATKLLKLRDRDGSK